MRLHAEKATPRTLAQCGVVELRHYTLKRGMRDRLLGVFEQHLIEPQERAGMVIAGLFADRDDPDAFVWFRGFADMKSRHEALHAFYDGPVWAEHRDAANATMTDSDDVLLLRPTWPEHPPLAPAHPRPAHHAAPSSPAWTVVTTYLHDDDRGLQEWLTTRVHTLRETTLGTTVSTWRSEPAENTFLRLPVRPVRAFVWTASFASEQAYLEAHARLEADPAWRTEVEPRLEGALTGRECRRLQPTARSSHQ
ncbi:NIPSNAP family protein [Prauserella sp. PE36]|uniref:NIPSNAP family protein n=1 Tax=Prauserella sp. PE36 TaxID=1504709 RepID=UPI000DE2971F|nr:NIPSNAP family protein [Prauserella sp. PE36]RBM11583.1 NIPSNAP family protein [Prauserella sp. PE36]